MENPNYIYNIQVNLTILKSENLPLTKGCFGLVSEKVELIKKELFSKVNDCCIMEESHKFTVNLLGKFDPYHYDKRKWNNSLLKYKSSEFWAKGETKEIVGRAFEGHTVHIFIGFMNFEKL